MSDLVHRDTIYRLVGVYMSELVVRLGARQQYIMIWSEIGIGFANPWSGAHL